jgi:hypothetical protein
MQELLFELGTPNFQRKEAAGCPNDLGIVTKMK